LTVGAQILTTGAEILLYPVFYFILLIKEMMNLKEIKEKPKHYVWSNVLFLLKDITRDYKVLLLFLIVEAFFGIVTPVLGICLPKLAVELVIEHSSTERVLIKLGIYIIVFIVAITLQNTAGRAKYMHYNDMRYYYLRKLFYKTLDCDYMQIESAVGQTRYQKARRTLDNGDWSGTSFMITSMLAIFTGTLSFILYSGVIAMLNPIIILLLAVMSALNYFALRYARNYEQKCKEKLSSYEKKINYIENASGDIKSAKDIRLYTMSDWFILVHEYLLDCYAALKHKIQNRHFVSSLVNIVTLLLRDGVAYAYLIRCVSIGKVTIAEFVLYFGAITGYSVWISQIVENINTIAGASLQMNDMREFLESSDASEIDKPLDIPALDSIISIEFRNVTFSYDNESAKVLKNFNMKIRSGEKIALVGENGAGKTTIVKLLCGFYRPDCGEILLNGIDISKFRKKELFTLFSAVFQDITILPFTVAENVSMKVEAKTDKKRVWNCLEKAGLANEIKKYERSIDSKMLKSVDENGIILSGGQQQKLLMARALYKDAQILILDEPTAALDPIAESEVYENFHAFSKNKTAIYISHRLASTRFCNKIFMINDGVIIESGTHLHLMQNNGEYAKMYKIQSHYYNSSEGEVAL
jgi:ATP-binding cassette, subfamily B, bacterial